MVEKNPALDKLRKALDLDLGWSQGIEHSADFPGSPCESPNARVLKHSLMPKFETFCISAIECVLLGAAQQTETGRCVILGKVVDATTNVPLPFASVVLQGQTSGTATDLKERIV